MRSGDGESRIIRIEPRFSEREIGTLRAGDRVLVTGQLLTARDAACRRIVETLDAGRPLPFPLEGRVVYTVGPTPAKPGQVIGSAGPTTATRMLPYLDRLLGAGMRAMIGKGDFPDHGADIFRRHGAVYFAAVGGAAATIAKTIKAVEVVAYADLGPEAVHRFDVENFPAIVAVDAEGNNWHAMARRQWRTWPEG